MRQRSNLSSQIAGELRQLIAEELEAGARLPAEKELAERLQVSRNTLREALWLLWSEGLLVRRWGVGTFVRDVDEPVALSLTDVAPLREIIRAAGHDPSLTEVDIEREPCPDDAAKALAVPAGDDVWRVDRVFAVDGTPVAFLREWVPGELNGRAIDPTVLKDVNADMLSLLRDTARSRIVRMEAQLEAIAATDEVAGVLAVEPGAPLIRSVQASYADSGPIVIYSHVYYDTSVIGLRLVRTARV